MNETMKIGQILESGYKPAYFKKSRVINYKVSTEYQTVLIETANDERVPLSLDLEKPDELEFEMVVTFSEEIAQALLITGVAPLEKCYAKPKTHRSFNPDFGDLAARFQRMRSQDAMYQNNLGSNSGIMTGMLSPMYK